MAGEFQQKIDRISAKARLVAERYSRLRQQRQEAQEQMARLEQENQSQHAEIEKLRQQIEYLQLATTLAPSRSQVADTRAQLSELVRDIDRCIIQLKQ